MATKTFYFKNAVPAGATLHRSLQDGGSAPTAATTTTGWVPGTKAIGQACLQIGGTEVTTADASWSATLRPSAAPTQTTGDSWRSENTLNGQFANSNWVFTFGIRSVTAAYTGRLKLALRVWRSANANGTSAVELTSARQASAATSANLSTSADTSVSITWSPGATFTLTNEYLFVNVGVEVTAAGSGATQDVDFRVASTYTLVTPDFSIPAAVTEAVSADDTPPTGLVLYAAPLAAESANASEVIDAGRVFAVSISETSQPPLGGIDFAGALGLGGLGRFTLGQVVLAQLSGDAIDAVLIPSGGSVYADSVSEAAAGLDAESALAVFAASFIEAAAALDTQSTVASFGAAVSETTSAADSVGSGVVFAGSISEAGAGLDAESALAIFAASLIEAAAALDTQSALASFAAAVNETTLALDSVSVAAVMAAGLTETLSAADSMNSAAVFAGSIAEARALADAISVTASLGAALAESAAAADQITAGISLSAALAESISGNDAISAAAGYPASLAESGSAVDALAGYADVLADFLEAADAADAITVRADLIADVLEAGHAVDLVSSGGVFYAVNVLEAQTAAAVIDAALIAGLRPVKRFAYFLGM